MSLGGLPAISKVFYSLIHINISSWVNSVSDWLFGELFFFFTFWLPGFFWVGGSYFCFSPFSPPYKYVNQFCCCLYLSFSDFSDPRTHSNNIMLWLKRISYMTIKQVGNLIRFSIMNTCPSTFIFHNSI